MQERISETTHHIAEEKLVFSKINEHIFAPFATFLFLDTDELFTKDMDKVKENLIQYLNQHLPTSLSHKVSWGTEDSGKLKASKGVFSVPGSDNSFIKAEITDFQDIYNFIKEKNLEAVYETIIRPKAINIYFNPSGVGSCCLDLSLSSGNGLTAFELDKISESLNYLYKEYLEDVCYDLTLSYLEGVKKLKVPHFQFNFIPEIKDVEKSKSFLPWTHRIYHIHNESLFELENPGEPFKNLLTPIASTDIENFAVYNNRYIYFGWGHSIILSNDESVASNIYNYVRLVQIAQVNWYCLNNISELIELARISFYKDTNKRGSKIKILTKNIVKVRNFTKCMETILDSFDGINITFDTEKRKLLGELYKRWQQNELTERVRNKLSVIEEFLDFLYVRKKEQRDGSLNTILSVITIIGIVEVIKTFIEFSKPVFKLNPEFNLISFVIGSIVSIISILFIAFKER